MANEIKTLLNSVDGVRKDWKEDWKDAQGSLKTKSDFSFSPRISKTTISAANSDNSYNDSGSGFVAAGFAVGQKITVTGFTGNTANNIASGILTAVTAAKLTVGGTDGNVIVDDAAGETVTITANNEPNNTVAPAITGSAVVGQTLTCSQGTWVNATNAVYKYQWFRAGVRVPGATATTYVLTSADAGSTMTCVVNANTKGGSTSVTTAATSTVSSGL